MAAWDVGLLPREAAEALLAARGTPMSFVVRASSRGGRALTVLLPGPEFYHGFIEVGARADGCQLQWLID